MLICDPKDGLARITETLTHDPGYKNTSPTTRATGMPLPPRFRRLGRTVLPRRPVGKGCCTGKFLTDACDKMKVNYNNKSSVETIEMNLLMKIPEKKP